MKVNHQFTKAQRRKIRIRQKIRGTAERPRLTVFRSNQHLYLQVINDETGITLVSSSDVAKEIRKDVKGIKKSDRTKAIALHLSEQLKKEKIASVVFDRGAYRYHGSVKLIAEELRQLGIQL